MEGQKPEEKKSFAWVYVLVAAAYVILVITYSVVVHNATKDGANNIEKDYAKKHKKDDDKNEAVDINDINEQPVEVQMFQQIVDSVKYAISE